MKHAFIFGTSIFLSTQNTLTFVNGDNSTEFLKVLSFYKHQKGFEDQALVIDAIISSLTDDPIRISNNQLQAGPAFRLETTANRLKVYQAGHAEPVLDVYQLEEHEYAGLSSHITNEIEAQHPDAVLTIKGNFHVQGAHFLIENEKMFIDKNGFANGVANAHHGVQLSAVYQDL
ncbi:hypothetical protein [Mucilaginibacter sp. SP1R1]|uniref:hypothetical protein n=1 Tax=Mucilaginibacter sp. SP1R1 TaxID=2723091 RepID=UPI00161277A1|nr:hypothetical protein [Mucilaginibacter sp. SP1R1]MBB6148463.1 hypothetical protein [Mucilaginibacter sp. SP1R1]